MAAKLLVIIWLLAGDVFLLPAASYAKVPTAGHIAGTTGVSAKLSILLLLNNNTGTQNTADGAVVLFNDTYSNAIADEDSYKFSNLDENLAIDRGGTLLSIEGRVNIISRDTIPLRLWQYRQTDYYFKFQGSNFAQEMAAVIRDAFTGVETPIDLTTETTFAFNVGGPAAAAAANRFSIIFYIRSVPASITLQPAETTVCASSNATFTAAATGFYLNYQWQVSTDGGFNYTNITDGTSYTGANTSSLTVNNVQLAEEAYKYRVIVAGSAPVSTDISGAAGLKLVNTWVGNVDSDWSNAANWTCNTIPDAINRVVISAMAPKMPLLSGISNVGPLTLPAGARINLNGNDLAIYGDIAGGGAFTGSLNSGLTCLGSGIINFAADSNLVTNFSVSSTANISLATDLNIAGVLSIAGVFGLNNHTVTLKAGTEGGVNFLNTTTYPNTAIVAPMTGTITYGPAGKFVAERYIPAGTRAFRFISSTVNTTGSIRQNWMENGSNTPGYGTHITGYGGSSNGFDPTITNNPSLFSYNNGSQVWSNVASTSATLHAGDASRLFVRGDRTIDLNTSHPTATATILRTTGTLQTGPVTYSAPFLTGANGSGLYNFVGNPYASPVRFSSLTKTNIAPSYWSWDPNIGERGIYINYLYFTDGNGNFTSGFNNTLGVSKMDDNIQPGQAFFIQSTGANPVLTFNEVDKTFGTTPVFRTMADISKFSVQLLLDTGAVNFKMADATLALFNPDFSFYAGAEDAAKFTNPDENIALMHHDTALSIEGRPLIEDADTLFIKLWQYRQKDYFLRTVIENLPPSVTALLKDNFLASEMPINPAGSLIPFSVTNDSASFAPDRFLILFKQSGLLPVVLTDLKAFRKDKGIQLGWISHTETGIGRYEIERSINGMHFDTIGKVEAKGNRQTAETYSWFDENPLAGDNYYRLKIIEKAGETHYTQIVKVTAAVTQGGISIFPNPVKGNTINVRLNKIATGTSVVSLFNSVGEQLFSETFQHTAETHMKSIKMDKRLPAGIYRLQLKQDENVFNVAVLVE